MEPAADRVSDDTQQSYDRVAAEYTERIFSELQDKPFDRELLDRFAAIAGPIGTVCDVGCGPGQVARFLHDRGLEAMGLDLSAEMVRQAQRLSPDIPFRQGTMLTLPFEDASLGGITAFYCIIHIPPPRLPAAFGEMWRVLRPGGSLLVAYHVGDEVRHVDEWFDQPVSLDFRFFEAAAIERLVEDAGFRVKESVERDPYPDVEAQTRRGYILAERPAANPG